MNFLLKGAGIMRIHLLASFLVVASLGCQSVIYGTAEDFDKLAIGMTKEQVIEAIGRPSSSAADSVKGEEYMVYKRMSSTAAWSPRNYVVTIQDSKVIRYGEQR
jgi:outer membrane protein assembly factor BamE (lipoprotein component of BamABCDE complex)